jgi:hypothetical protein
VGTKSIYYGKKATNISYRIARNYNSKPTGWGRVDKIII